MTLGAIVAGVGFVAGCTPAPPSEAGADQVIDSSPTTIPDSAETQPAVEQLRGGYHGSDARDFPETPNGVLSVSPVASASLPNVDAIALVAVQHDTRIAAVTVPESRAVTTELPFSDAPAGVIVPVLIEVEDGADLPGPQDLVVQYEDDHPSSVVLGYEVGINWIVNEDGNLVAHGSVYAAAGDADSELLPLADGESTRVLVAFDSDTLNVFRLEEATFDGLDWSLTVPDAGSELTDNVTAMVWVMGE